MNISSCDILKIDSEQIPILLGVLFLQNVNPIDATRGINS